MNISNSRRLRNSSAALLAFVSAPSTLSNPQKPAPLAENKINSSLVNVINPEFISVLFRAAARHEFNQEGATVKFTDSNGAVWVTPFAGIVAYKMSSQYVTMAPAPDGTKGTEVQKMMTCLLWGKPAREGMKPESLGKLNSVCLSGINIPTALDTHWNAIPTMDFEQLLAYQQQNGWNSFWGYSIQRAEIADARTTSEKICHMVTYYSIGETTAVMPPAKEQQIIRDVDGDMRRGPAAPICFKTHVSTSYAMHAAG